MSVNDHFSSPLKTCRWASKQIDKFETAERRFFEKHPGEEFNYVEAPTALVVHVIEFKTRPTDALEEMAYRAVGDLSNSLDQAVYAACKSLSVEPKRANFPVGDSEIHFKRQLESKNGPYRDIPVELHPKLTEFEPFPADETDGKGNPLLRALREMANPNKHHLPLGIEVQTGGKFYGASGPITMFGSLWDWKGRTILYKRVPGFPYKVDMELEPRIAFGQVAGMAGKPVTRTFREMLPMVEGIIAALKAETIRILGT